MFNEKWILKGKNASEIAKKYNISELMAKIMINRNIESDNLIKSYINTDYSYLNNPRDMKDMDKAVEIIKDKIKENKKIRIIGDYDVDGVISVYILYTAFKKIDANVDYEIPDRIKDGYGINENIIKLAYEDKVDTIITCDNGIAAIDQIKYAKDLGMTVIVTDHHDVAFVEENDEKRFILPNADAILNPKQIDCNYKFKSICGAGVSFKLIEVLYQEFNLDTPYEFLEFVAIATVCDVVDLIDENRIFVKKGLEMLNNSSNVGINALKKANNLENKKIDAYHLGFVIGPCINASGRLDSAKKSLQMLINTDKEFAEIVANQIVSINEERKTLTVEGTERVIQIIENLNLKKDDILVVYIDNLHESLAGIIAGRVKEKYNKPTIVITKSEEGLKGSARSIEEYNMFEGLLECKDLLTKFGGHPMAAGLSLKEENLEVLRKRLNENSKLTKEDLTKKIYIDLGIDINRVNFSIIGELEKLEPFGKGNEKPVFGAKNVSVVKGVFFGKENQYLKLILNVGGILIDGMIFSNIEYFERKVIERYDETTLDSLYNKDNNNVLMDFTFYPSSNEWNGNKKMQIMISSIR